MVDILTDKDQAVDKLIQEGRSFMDDKDLRSAHHRFRDAYELNPEDAKSCSYYGFTIAKLENKVHKGLELCAKAAKSGYPDPMFFLNLGNVYIMLGRKREAVGAFKKGLQIDRSHKQIFNAWREKLGYRRKPALPFLSRENFLNKMIGKWTYKKLQKKGKV